MQFLKFIVFKIYSAPRPTSRFHYIQDQDCKGDQDFPT